MMIEFTVEIVIFYLHQGESKSAASSRLFKGLSKLGGGFWLPCPLRFLKKWNIMFTIRFRTTCLAESVV
jgi:hypothetical protein